MKKAVKKKHFSTDQSVRVHKAIDEKVKLYEKALRVMELEDVGKKADGLKDAAQKKASKTLSDIKLARAAAKELRDDYEKSDMKGIGKSHHKEKDGFIKRQAKKIYKKKKTEKGGKRINIGTLMPQQVAQRKYSRITNGETGLRSLHADLLMNDNGTPKKLAELDVGKIQEHIAQEKTSPKEKKFLQDILNCREQFDQANVIGKGKKFENPQDFGQQYIKKREEAVRDAAAEKDAAAVRADMQQLMQDYEEYGDHLTDAGGEKLNDIVDANQAVKDAEAELKKAEAELKKAQNAAKRLKRRLVKKPNEENPATDNEGASKSRDKKTKVKDRIDAAREALEGTEGLRAKLDEARKKRNEMIDAHLQGIFSSPEGRPVVERSSVAYNIAFTAMTSLRPTLGKQIEEAKVRETEAEDRKIEREVEKAARAKAKAAGEEQAQDSSEDAAEGAEAEGDAGGAEAEVGVDDAGATRGGKATTRMQRIGSFVERTGKGIGGRISDAQNALLTSSKSLEQRRQQLDQPSIEMLNFALGDDEGGVFYDALDE